jgi:hypothetical protein
LGESFDVGGESMGFYLSIFRLEICFFDALKIIEVRIFGFIGKIE